MSEYTGIISLLICTIITAFTNGFDIALTSIITVGVI
ncbi:MAG: hypothetical protein ACJA0Q_000929, partial [Saprospiraceae bacterium]